MSETKFRLPPLTVPRATAVTPRIHRHPLESLRHQIESLYYDFAGGMWPVHTGLFVEAPSPQPLIHGGPVMDIRDTGNAYEVTAELPGLGLANITLSLAGGVLSIKGDRPAAGGDDEIFLLRERPHGGFERSFRLPDDVDSAKIEAAFRDGILSVQLPKNSTALKAVQKIPVQG